MAAPSPMDISNPTLSLPRRFGAYTLLRRLSRGGMGQVFLARGGGLAGAERVCVIKTLRGDLAADPEYVSRFVDEARVVVTLAHSGVCHVFDAGQVGTTIYLAMEHIAGVTLRALQDELAARHQRLPSGHALFIAVELLDALDYAHHHVHPQTGEQLGIVHRDISPQNVMVTVEGEVKLIDFGLAKSSLKAEATGLDSVMGKLFYMSPEQAHAGDVDGTTDQFAAAIVLYELLTGKRFYGTRSADEVFTFVGRGGFLPDDIDALPPDIAAALRRALSASREDRFPSCGSFGGELRQLLAREHPLMSRTALRAYLAQQLPAVIEAVRAQVRDLPRIDDPTLELAQVEPTQSFASAAPVRPRPVERAGVSGSLADRREGDTDETMRTLRRAAGLDAATPGRRRVVAAAGLAALGGLAIVLTLWPTRSRSTRDITIDAGAAVAGETGGATVPAIEGPAAAVAAVVVAAVDAGGGAALPPVEPIAAGASQPHRPRSRARPRVAVPAPAAGAGVPAAAASTPADDTATPSTASLPARRPGSVEAKRATVLRCQNQKCAGVRRLIAKGAAVDEPVLDDCIEDCIGP